MDGWYGGVEGVRPSPLRKRSGDTVFSEKGPRIGSPSYGAQNITSKVVSTPYLCGFPDRIRKAGGGRRPL